MVDLLTRIWASPRYRNKGSVLRGAIFNAMPWESGEELSPLVEAPWGPPKSGDWLAHCPKGFWDIYVIPAAMFRQDFDLIDEALK